MTLHRIEQLPGVISGAVLEDDLDVFDIRDASGWITFRYYQVRVLPGRNRADLVLAAEKYRTIQSRDPKGLDRREPGLDQELDLTLITKAGDVTADANRVRSRQQ